MNEVQTTPPIRFSETLDHLWAEFDRAPAKLSLREVVLMFGPKGHVLLILFFVLPFLQPIPIPGLSTALGFLILMAGYFMFLNEPPWLPNFVAKLQVEKKFLLRITSTLESLLRKVERVVKPRGQPAFARPRVRAFNGLMLSFHAFLLALPLPVPISNFLPALVIALLALGCLEEDIYVLVVGYLVAVVNAAFFGFLLYSPFFIKELLS